MKKLLLSLLLATVCFATYAQNTFPTSGNVGIGTTTPTSDLEIFDLSGSKPGGTSAPTKSVSKLSREGTSGYSYNENAEFRIGHGGPSVWGSQVDLYINGASNQTGIPDQQAMTWLYNGNVGIGTTSPQTRFHVVGNGSTLDGGNNQYNGDGIIIQGNTGGRSTTTGAQLEFVIPANTDGTNPWGQGRIITVAGDLNTGDATGKMIFGTRRMFNKLGTGSQWYYGNDIVINGTGNVGIGTLNPDQLLTVNGTIHAKQVNIDLNVPAPDYVFDRTYKLRTLTAVNHYILMNKHLPEIPSAATMAKDGVNVSELNMKLLQKVEELTLYLIEKDEQVKSQQLQLDNQQKQLDQLKTQLSSILKQQKS